MQWYIDHKQCIRCRKIVNCVAMSEIEKKETKLSGYCKICQDNVFHGESDPLDTDTSEFDRICIQIDMYIRHIGNTGIISL